MRRTDYRSKEAGEYRKLYSTAAWKAKRKAQLDVHYLCRMCDAAGLVVAATIVDHVKPHRGDLDLFWNGDLQSLCKRCHDGAKQRIERGGFDSVTDLYGYPLDPSHPSNSRTCHAPDASS